MNKIIDYVMNMGRLAALGVALAALSFLLTCSEADDPTSGRLVVVGSESVRRAMDDEAREFMAMYGKAVVRAIGVGSEVGLKAMFDAPRDKDTVLAMSARPLSEAERTAAVQQGLDPREYRIAIDGIAVIVNAANPVDELTIDQVRDIFTGRVANWKQVGGPARPIRVVFGQPNSATYGQIRDSVLRGDGLSPSARHFDTMYSLVQAVASDRAAIGYCGSSYLYRDWIVRPPYPEPGIKALALARTAAGPFVTPDPGTVYDKSYPLWRYIYLCTRREPKGVLSGFVTFVMSSKGQQLLVRQGFAPTTVKFIVKREAE